jgi:hypothetical protein
MNVIYLISSYFLGVFAKLQKAAVIFVMSARPPDGTTWLPLDEFSF